MHPLGSLQAANSKSVNYKQEGSKAASYQTARLTGTTRLSTRRLQGLQAVSKQALRQPLTAVVPQGAGGYIYICIHIYIYIYIYIYIHACIHACMLTCIHAYM